MAHDPQHSINAESNSDGITGSSADIAAAFRDMIKQIACPHCGDAFTDSAVDWSYAWHEGRRDILLEFDTQERDGPCKINCEQCDKRSWVNYFAGTASVARG